MEAAARLRPLSGNIAYKKRDLFHERDVATIGRAKWKWLPDAKDPSTLYLRRFVPYPKSRQRTETNDSHPMMVSSQPTM